MIQMLCDRCSAIVGNDSDPKAATGRRVTTGKLDWAFDLCDPCLTELKDWVGSK